MMRVLHTADWHLGHRLYNRDRTPEHRAALDWLIRTIDEEGVDLVIVAGDVFDVTNPSNQAKELYFNFLGQLLRTCCKAAVVVGGNHDSASMLNAPRPILDTLQLHVVGGADAPAAERTLHITCGDREAIVAAVPYLRERDLRRSNFAETQEDRLQSLRRGITDHFSEMAEVARGLRGNRDLPIVATGHLFASGASDDEEKKSYIYQANEHNIGAGEFPDCFDYVALGHIHRAQHVGEQDHIRYAGSLIPLTFVEGQSARSVRIVDLGRAGQPVNSRKVTLPPIRQLLRLNYELEEVVERLRTAARSVDPSALTPWAEIRVKTDAELPNLREKLLKVVREAQSDPAGPPAIELVRISRERLTPYPRGERQRVRQLDELAPEEVFTQLCGARGVDVARKARLLNDFRQLRNWMDERDDKEDRQTSARG